MNDIMNGYADSNAMIASDLDGIGETEEETVNEDDTMLCKRVVTKDRRYITQITCFEKGQQHTFGAKAVSPATSGRSKGKKRNNGNVPASNGMPAAGTERNALRLPVFGKQQGGGALASLFSLNRQLGRLP